MTTPDLGNAPRDPRAGLFLNYRRHALLFLAAAAACAAVAGLAMAFGETGRRLAALPWTGAAVGVFAGVVIWALDAGWRRRIAAFADGRYLIHWRYDEQSWPRQCELSAGRTALGPLTLAVWLGVGAAAIAVLTLAQNGAPMPTRLLAGAAAGAGGAILGVGAAWAIEAVGRRSRAQRARRPGEVFVGEHGLYISGEYWPWGTLAQGLAAVTLSETPPLVASFVFRSGGALKTVRVLVPEGREAEARNLMRQLDEG